MIRDFRTDDTDALVTVWKAASSIAHPFLSDDFIESEADNLRNIYLIHTQTRVIQTGEPAAGFIAMMGNEIGGLFLDPNLHGRGYGRALVNDISKRHRTIEVEVFERNSVGRRFYDRYGFKQIGKSIHQATGETILRLAHTATKMETAA